ncbi:MAG: hypothetical protein ACT4OO_10800 [Nitrospiraceae bacterium]
MAGVFNGCGLMKHFLIAISLLFVWGCQAIETHHRVGQFDHEAFGRLWSAYEQCRSLQDVEKVVTHAAWLTQAVPAQEDWFAGIPKPLARFITHPPVRLAADPKALAADCTLQAGQAAFEAGQAAVARDLYASMLARYAEPSYEYYVAQARLRLVRVEQALTVAPFVYPLSLR